MDAQALSRAIHEVGLGRHEESVLASARWSLRITLSRHAGEHEVGATRFGGRPDLPEGTRAPQYQGRPIAFVAQIRLADLAESPVAADLPSAGLLSFWYEGTGEAWGFDPADRGSASVLFFGPEAELARSAESFGLPPLPACDAMTSSELTLPPVGASPSLAFERLEIPSSEHGAYFELLRRLGHEEQDVHRMGGYPNQIQGDMQLQCQLVTNGLYCGSASDCDVPLAEELRVGADDWGLLLQVDSGDQLAVTWKDAGRIYFWVRAADATESRFDRSWLVLQSY
jgi:uncharacterized protein YwqG